MAEDNGKGLAAVEALLDVMATLRDPDKGCPWDCRQTFESIAPYTVEEAYEVADAIDRADWDELRGELGDLLFQVVFHARMAEERGLFDFAGVAEAIVEKMVRRHPHVFGETKIRTEAELKEAWEAEKAREREAKGQADTAPGALHGVARALPALVLAQKLQKRAVRAGLPFPSAEAQLRSELDVLADVTDRSRLDAVGDLLFAAVSLAREQGVDAEQALRHASHRFETRFEALESRLAEADTSVEEADEQTLKTAWEEID